MYCFYCSFLSIIITFGMVTEHQYECFVWLCVCAVVDVDVHGRVAYQTRQIWRALNHNLCTKQSKIIRSTGHFDWRSSLRSVHVCILSISQSLLLPSFYLIEKKQKQVNQMHYRSSCIVLAIFTLLWSNTLTHVRTHRFPPSKHNALNPLDPFDVYKYLHEHMCATESFVLKF